MRKTIKKRIFLDYASITPMDKRVESERVETQKLFWANPSSLHIEGERAKTKLEEARIKIASILHCRSSEIFFTSGGTESLNIAILGAISFAGKSQTPHIIVSSIEHSAILEPVKFLLKEGKVEVSFVSPDSNGKINPESIKRELKPNTALVIVQHANNEIGVVQPVHKIAGVVKEYRAKTGSLYPYFLVDASQSFLYEKVSLESLQSDMIVLDGIKIYGPRGIGLLALRRSISILPTYHGGGQEKGLRPGTEDVPSIAALAKAMEIGEKLREKESIRLSKLRDYAVSKILKELPNTSLNGGREERLPNNINICFPGEESEFLVIKLDTLGFAVSAASACQTLSPPTPKGRGADQSVGLENGSYVIESLGKPECASSSLRFTLGRSTKKSDLDALISALKKIIKPKSK